MLLSCIIIYKNRRLAAAVNRLLDTHFPAHFHTASALSAPSLRLPRVGKAAIREYHLLKKGGEAATRALSPEP